ncbi:MAG: Kelch repeat-containing protein [Candidatus Binataceae bacterium]
MALSVVACAENASRRATPGVRLVSASLPEKLALRMPLMNLTRVEATATILTAGPNAGKILVAGGRGAAVDAGSSEFEPVWASTEVYDPGSNTFIYGPSMHAGRDSHTATMIVSRPNAGKILIAGGEDGSYPPLSSTELYDPASNTFMAGPSMHANRIGHTATAIDYGPNASKILVAGGDGDVSAQDSTELYDSASNTFALGPPMSGQRMAHTATVITSGPNTGKILIAGGNGYSFTGHGHSGTLASTELYDPVANTFAPGPSMNAARESATATVIDSGPNAGKILIAGGLGESRAPLSSTELYDPASNTFAPGPAMKVARQEHTATVIACGPNAGKILIAGGIGAGKGTDSYLASTELYNPLTNTFAAGPSMNVARYEDTATLIPSGPNAGMILLAGGASYVGVLASVELYDPATNKFAPPANTPRMKYELLPPALFREPP